MHGGAVAYEYRLAPYYWLVRMLNMVVSKEMILNFVARSTHWDYPAATSVLLLVAAVTTESATTLPVSWSALVTVVAPAATAFAGSPVRASVCAAASTD